MSELGPDTVDTKSRQLATIGNDGVGFIRVRKRKLRGRASRVVANPPPRRVSASASFDLVHAVRINGKPRHVFVLGLGSQQADHNDGAVCWFWAYAIRRMIEHGLTEDQRARLIAEMVRKGARLPEISEYESFVREAAGRCPGINELPLTPR
jgi:hypothetical protein